MTVASILHGRKADRGVVALAPEDTLAETIGVMMQHGISQVPVMEDGKVVGSLTEKRILGLLIEEPDARDRAVREVMGDPLPILPMHTTLEELSAHLDAQTGAVLVHAADGDHYDIITRSDLISALAESGRSQQKSR